MPKIHEVGVGTRDMTPEEEKGWNVQIAINRAEAAARPMQELREKRNRLLAETDWWAGQDLIMTQAQKDYRQALRDLTTGLDTVEKVNAVTWPEKPEE